MFPVRSQASYSCMVFRNLKQEWSHIGIAICYQHIDAKNWHIYGIHLLNPYKTIVSHLNSLKLIFVNEYSVVGNCMFNVQINCRLKDITWEVAGNILVVLVS